MYHCKNSGSRKRKAGKKKPAVSPRKLPARKTRTKTRKPKYLSLNLQLSNSSPQRKEHKKILPPRHHQQQRQEQQELKTLIPPSPGNLLHDSKTEMQDHEDQAAAVADQVAFLFSTAATDTSSTLHGILDEATTPGTTTSEDCGGMSASYLSTENCGALVRAAMRRKEREESEERWVSYWEVVEKKEMEEVSSCSGGGGGEVEGKGLRRVVGLKLDYEEIMNAWCDKGPLYVDVDSSPQVVPDLHASSHALIDGWGNIWKVPEMREKKEEGSKWKLGQREASMLRYKTKRHTRLFSNKIRYQVRKLNAEKRPRFKGRFVKRNGEEE